MPTRSNYRNDGRKQFSFDDISVSKLLRDVSFGKHGSFKANHVFFRNIFFPGRTGSVFLALKCTKVLYGRLTLQFLSFFSFLCRQVSHPVPSSRQRKKNVPDRARSLFSFDSNREIVF